MTRVNPTLLSKKIYINTVIIFFLFWPVFDFITLREDFPFAPYIMYSGMHKPSDFNQYQVIFVDQSGNELSAEELGLGAMDSVRLVFGLQRDWLDGKHDQVKKRLAKLLKLSHVRSREMEKEPILGVRFLRFNGEQKELLEEIELSSIDSTEEAK